MNVSKLNSNSSNILFFNFNQEANNLSVGTTNGYFIYTTQPKFELLHYFDHEPIGTCEMLFTTSLVALVGDSEDGKLTARKLHLVNTKNQSLICEFNFATPILAVKMTKKRLVVVLETKILVYDMNNTKLVHSLETCLNPRGICAVSASDEQCFLAYPEASDKGYIAIFDLLNLQPHNVVKAHKTSLAKIAFSSNGTLIASASKKGTVIRVFDVLTYKIVFQFRRGKTSASINSISFSQDSLFLCVSSAHGTIHVFKLENPSTTASPGKPSSANPTSPPPTYIGLMNSYLPVIGEVLDSGIRAFATGKVPSAATENLCAISSSNTSVLVGATNGVFYQFSMDPKNGGELKLVEENKMASEKISSKMLEEDGLYPSL